MSYQKHSLWSHSHHVLISWASQSPKETTSASWAGQRQGKSNVDEPLLLIAKPQSISCSSKAQQWAPETGDLMGGIYHTILRNSSLHLAQLTEVICSQISKLVHPVGKWEGSRQDGEKVISRFPFKQRPSPRHSRVWPGFPSQLLSPCSFAYSLTSIYGHFPYWNSSCSFGLPQR